MASLHVFINSTLKGYIYLKEHFIIVSYLQHIIMKRKIKQWWSTIQPISTNRTTISHLKSLNIKKKH